MTFNKNAENYLNKLLLVTPVYGWGWEKLIDGISTKSSRDAEPLQPFCLRLLRLFLHENALCGGIGKVEEPAHMCQNFWVVFSARHAEEYDFNKPLQYNLALGPEEPSKDEWPQFKTGSPRFVGFGEIVSQV